MQISSFFSSQYLNTIEFSMTFTSVTTLPVHFQNWQPMIGNFEIATCFRKTSRTHRSEILLLVFKTSLKLVVRALLFSLKVIKTGAPPHQQMRELKATIPKRLSSNRLLQLLVYVRRRKVVLTWGAASISKPFPHDTTKLTQSSIGASFV